MEIVAVPNPYLTTPKCCCASAGMRIFHRISVERVNSGALENSKFSPPSNFRRFDPTYPGLQIWDLQKPRCRKTPPKNPQQDSQGTRLHRNAPRISADAFSSKKPIVRSETCRIVRSETVCFLTVSSRPCLETSPHSILRTPFAGHCLGAL